MKALKWITAQIAITLSSWLFAALWGAALFRLLDIEEPVFWILGAVAAGVLPCISFFESLLMRLLGRENRMGFLNSLFTAVALVIAPLLGGYLYLIGECLTCEPILAVISFAVLMFAIPIALVQNTLRKIILKL